MLKDFLPENLYKSLILTNSESEINEIRIRAGKPITYLCNTKSYFLGQNGATNSPNQALYGSYSLIEDIVFRASNFSIYAVNEQLKQGFIMVDGGIRIGVCGDVVFDGEVKTIKNFSSICIRVPHMIKNVSLPIFKHILNDGDINNTLIISPPGAGKTTMLRDLIYQFSNHNYPYNIFIADERGEITGGINNSLNLGNFYDKITFLNKKATILMGIRSMSPDILITDELGTKDDFESIEYASNCGISLICTIHAKDLNEVKNKPEFKAIMDKEVFKRFVILSKNNGIGTIEGVYKENFCKIYGAAVW